VVPVTIRGQDCIVLAATKLIASGFGPPRPFCSRVLLIVIPRPLKSAMKRGIAATGSLEQVLEPLLLVVAAELAIINPERDPYSPQSSPNRTAPVPIPDGIVPNPEILSQLAECLTRAGLCRLDSRPMVGEPNCIVF